MLNAQQINSFQINSNPSLNEIFQEGVVLADDFAFNGLGLHNDNIYITETDDENGTAQELRAEGYSTDPGKQILLQRDSERVVRLDGVICYDVGETGEEKRENFHKYLDDFKKKLFADSGFLDIKIGSLVRRYKATLINRDSMFQGSGKQINYREFSLKFEVLDDAPYGKDPNLSSESFFDIDQLIYTADLYSAGNAPAKLRIIILVKTASDITGIKIHNVGESETIKFTETVSDENVIVIDCDDKYIKINGEKKKPRGTWLSVKNGMNQLKIEAIGTAIDYDATFNWKDSFL